MTKLSLWGSREKPRESSTQKKTRVVRIREVLEAVGWCMCAPCFRLVFNIEFTSLQIRVTPDGAFSALVVGELPCGILSQQLPHVLRGAGALGKP